MYHALSGDWGKGDVCHFEVSGFKVLQYCITTNQGLNSVQSVIVLFKNLSVRDDDVDYYLLPVCSL